MRKLLILLAILTIGGAAWAVDVWKSSYTATADTTQNLCVNRRGFLHAVIVDSGAINSSITIYNSSAAAVNPIAVIDSGLVNYLPYDVVASTRGGGLTYSTVGSAKHTILYECY